MKLTVFRAAIVALLILKYGNVQGFQFVATWVFVVLFLVDSIYIWVRHLVVSLGLIRKYEERIYQAEIDRIRNSAIRNIMKQSKGHERKAN